MRLLVFLVVLAALLFAGDTWFRAYVEGQLASRVQEQLNVDEKPEVSLGGFPFTVAMLRSEFPKARIEAERLRRGGLVLRNLEIEMERVELSWAEKSARVDQGEGSAVITPSAMTDFLVARTNLGDIRIDAKGLSARIPVIGRRVTLPLSIDDGALILDLPRFADVSVPLPRPLTGLRYAGVRVTDAGVELDFSLNDSVLR